MLLGLDSYSYHLAFGCHPDFRAANPMNLHTFIDRVIELGLDGFQIDPLHLPTTDENYLQEIRERAKQKNLFVEHGVIGVKPESIEAGVRVCQILGSSVLRCFIGFDRLAETTDLRKEIKIAEQHIRESLGTLETFGVRLAIENHADVDSLELVKLVKRINSQHVGICLDVGNPLCTPEHPLKAVKRMARLAVTTHIKDYVIVPTNYGCKITGVELGKGILPLREIVRIIREESPLEHLVLELPIEAESDEEKSLEKEDNAVRKSVSYCREVLEIA